MQKEKKANRQIQKGWTVRGAENWKLHKQSRDAVRRRRGGRKEASNRVNRRKGCV